MDPFKGRSSGLESPITSSAVITPNDAADVPIIPRGISVNVSGLVRYDGLTTGTAIDVYLLAGVIHPIRAKKVWVTGTAATGIVGHW